MNRIASLLLLSLLLAACGGGSHSHDGSGAHEGEAHEAAAHEADADHHERGPHRGRMLRDGDFALEVTIFETNVPPQYRLYAYQGGEPLPPQDVQATVRLTRLDGEVNDFTFTPEHDYLKGSGEVTEPHSFDVQVSATHAGSTHRWEYASHEGRTSIPAAVAGEAGIQVEAAGPAIIRDTVRLMGAVVLDSNRHARVGARFPGIVRAVEVGEGDPVRRGQVLAQVEGSDSLRVYAVTAPIDGVVLERSTNIGDVAGSDALFQIADLSRVWVELRAVGADAGRLAPGQQVDIIAATSGERTSGRIATLLPLAAGQSVVARVGIANPDGRWRPGMTVSGEVTVSSRQVPLAVKETGLQRFRDFTVVFARVGETYEVRMLELGGRDGQYAEVLGGLKPGTTYVTEQSFLIKADVEKSGASHDH